MAASDGGRFRPRLGMAAVTGAADRLRATAQAAGVLKDDPLAVLVEVLADAILQVTRGQKDLVSSAEDLSGRLSSLLTSGRELASVEADRFRAELAASEADIVRRVGKAITEAADAGLARRGRALDRQTALLAASTLVVVLAGAAFSGWWAGREVGRSEVGSLAADVQGVFRQGAEVADAWRDLIIWNDLRSALQTCRGPGETFVQAGRRACRIPFWLSRPSTPSP